MEEKKTLQDEEQEPQQVEQFGEPIHIFPVEGGGMYWVLESQLPDEEREPEQVVFSEERTQPLNNQIPQVAPAAPRIGVLLPFVIIFVHLAIILTVVLLTSLQTVTITVTPKSQQITANITLATIPSRVFSPLTLTRKKTIQTTGLRHQDATDATGTITFYNAAPFTQTIDAGELLTSGSGIHIVTDETAIIPAGNPPIEGQTTITAHAVTPGSQGNLSAYDISGECCKDNVLVKNLSAFSGGQDSRTYSIVTKQDIQHGLATLQPAIEQTINDTFTKQMKAAETLTPFQCSQTISTNHQAGDEARTVTVTVKKSCIAGAYNNGSLQSAVIQALSQTEPGYQPAAYLQTSPLQATIRTGQVILTANYQATMIYHFSQREITTLVKELKGRHRSQALQLLASLPGVERIAITSLTNQEVLPTDTQYIHLVIGS